jgi:glycerol-3-phosphate responsive antiterminator
MNIIKYAKNKSRVLNAIRKNSNAVIMTSDKDIFDILKKNMKPLKTSEVEIHLNRDIVHDIILHNKVNYFIYNDNNYKMDNILSTKLILI